MEQVPDLYLDELQQRSTDNETGKVETTNKTEIMDVTIAAHYDEGTAGSNKHESEARCSPSGTPS
jgi:hypothetical protein